MTQKICVKYSNTFTSDIFDYKSKTGLLQCEIEKNGEKRHQAKNLISAPGHKCDHRGAFDGKSNPLIGL